MVKRKAVNEAEAVIPFYNMVIHPDNCENAAQQTATINKVMAELNQKGYILAKFILQ
jgi:hypothetical protein